MKKQNKIIVAVHTNPEERTRIIQRIVVDLGFAVIPSDAKKLIRQSVDDINLSRAYFVIADNFNFRQNPITVQRLFEMAARGMAVILGTQRLQREFELLCEAYYDI